MGQVGRCHAAARGPAAAGRPAAVTASSQHAACTVDLIESPPGARLQEDTVNLRMNKSKLAAASLLAAVVVGGGASIAAASTPATSTPADSSVSSTRSDGDGEQADGQDGGSGSQSEGTDPSYTGSLTAPASTEQPDGSETAGSDSAEQAALKAVATVTPAQAEQAATAAVPGTVAESDLGNENGFVFYSVEVNGSNGTVTEVIVDAGNGAVLAQQAQDARDAADAPDQPESATDAPD
jgi:hypothetical protein